MRMRYIINTRFTEYCEYRKLSQSVVKKDLGVKSKSQVSNWWNDVDPLPFSQIIKIIKTYSDINANWLINGKGAMILQVTPEVNEPKGEYKNAPTSPNTDTCTNPICLAEKVALYKRINELHEEKIKWLEEQKGDTNSGKKVKGGVEKPQQTGTY